MKTNNKTEDQNIRLNTELETELQEIRDFGLSLNRQNRIKNNSVNIFKDLEIEVLN